MVQFISEEHEKFINSGLRRGRGNSAFIFQITGRVPQLCEIESDGLDNIEIDECLHDGAMEYATGRVSNLTTTNTT